MLLRWLRRLISGPSQENVKNFDEETASLRNKQFRHQGQRSIETDKIVGSVGRAHELDNRFRYRKRDDTARYHFISDAAREGRPTEPIKVVRVKRDRASSEYYVIDGHHRVAQAKRQKYENMNADITDLIAEEDDTTQDAE
ncbi:MAG: ParB N-terminal domain-containing protein [Anaerolineales bacterium]